MVSDGLEHLSKRTRERAFILARNAKTVGIPLGAVRFTPHYDYMSYYLTNGSGYAIILCMPLGYLAEMLMEKDGHVISSYFAIKNIRHFLQRLKREGYKDIDVPNVEDGSETDLRSWLEDLDEE